MAKELTNINLFVKGDPAEASPASAFVTYDVTDGAASKTNNVYDISEPDFTKTGLELWTAAVTAIKAAEGIS